MEFIKENNEVIVYEDEAKEWLDFALESMKERMGWEFPQVIEEWLFEFIAEVGYVLKPYPSDTLWCWDNAYVNGEWGLIEDRGWDDEEAKRLYEKGNLLFFDEASGYYVERF
ncbi:hypothetical protein CUPS4244_08525 [Campylobacter upsaliensis]|uniref:hypothetical protein n=1 Tax=Campylobacter upsaliensis TaxID=28080 RepID=UPI00214A4134|nr:hypothetical protein [Campylobacter upsaliensis]MCR2105117.1 hypothetical protein [Campylobacter upsaliensis]